ncbi:MAG TPA: hypothetical protein VHX52_08600 [Steroidobacteraceae bacterium]|nr:hypothetical protein [Steroidobacteraceae bacterium]
MSCGVAHADVTVDQQTSMSVSGINIDIATTERTSSDKQRSDSQTKCGGFMALLCRDAQRGEIVRLDKQLQWQLEPKKKQYTEHPFPTAEERALAQQRLQKMMDEMKKCPVPQATPTAQSAPDTSHCQPSSPQVDVKQTDEHATLAGHDSRKSSIVLSQTCTEPQSGDVCEIDYGFDVWLTSDNIPGFDERSAFTKNYLAAQGLDQNNPQLQGMMQQYMAPYADALKQLQGKSSGLTGYPLRTSFYMAFGGPHCGRAQQAQSQQTQAPTSGAGGGGGFLHGLASNAVSGGLGGLFHRKVNPSTGSVGGQVAANAANQTGDAAANAAGSAAGNAAASAAPSHSQTPGSPAATPSDKVRVISFTAETTSISTASIPADQFEIPAGWKLQPPPARQEKEQQFTCPAPRN